jgi:DNA-binding MarR family transcriptional regulator
MAMAQDTESIDPAVLEAFRQEHMGRLLLNAQRDYSLRALTKLRARGHGGLSLVHTNLLPHIDVNGTRITTLAERAGVSKQAVGNLVGELAAKGYVRRDVDPHDRRAAVVTFTASGRAFLHDAHLVKREIEAEYAATLGERGVSELRRLLLQLLRGASAD